jgi:hypothetical protein
MAKLPQSEYEGGGVMPNGIFPQDDGVLLSASDQLMLLSSTGQTTDSHAPVDPYYWHGGMDPGPAPKQPKRTLKKRSERYYESPSQY